MNLSPPFKAGLRACCGLAVLVVLALSSLWLADLQRDPAAIRAAVGQAFQDHRLGDGEGVERFGLHRASHFSECVGLSTAILPKAANALWFTLESPALLWQPPKPMCESLRDAVGGQAEQPYFAYSRYWHGYRLLTEPALSFLSYGSLQSLCSLLLGVAALGVIASAVMPGRSTRWTIRSLAAPCAGLLFLSATVDWQAIARMPTHAVSMAVLLLCWAFAMLPRPSERSGLDTALPAAFLMGAVYNFFDFLYNPDLLAFLLGWSFFMRAVPGRALRPALSGAVAVQVIAIVGYMAMWAAKWALVRIGGDLLAEKTFMPTQDFNRWIAGGEQAYVPFKASYALLVESTRMPLGWWPLAACAVVLCALLASAVLRRRSAGVLAVTALALFPLFLLELKANHTFMHAAFTFRFVPFALILTTIGAALALRRESAARP
ncbi:hypothetical protein [Labrys monachus]|uniref:Uncharacterized protein n=1 Tax=Labrys monachus TaxID=217067 RepID=A0ABU0FEZ7_9HYPH|nr:hypothetical protein [Labrys monachus]MDQ0392673.1 hypothetical protein [Labrys monachus]